jgi:hypothetical protein
MGTTAPTPPACEEAGIQNEFRFATVIHGGVSLALYMNSVTRELFNLIRSTSCTSDIGGSSTEKVYRKLAQILSKSPDDNFEIVRSRSDQNEIHYRCDFGPSAGGIYGIFLAKALANDQPLDNLHDLWIEEGDFAKLIDDKKSRNGIGPLPPQPRPNSLRSSERMYIKLYDALSGMDKKAPATKSPYVNQLDLFVTTTDIYGQGAAAPGR